MPKTTSRTRPRRGTPGPTLAPAAILAAALLALVAPALAQAEPIAPGADYVPGEVIVRYEAGEAAEGRRTLRASPEVSKRERLPAPRIDLVKLAPGVSVRAAIRRLGRRPEVAYAEPNYRRELFALPDDPLFPLLWALHNTGRGRARADADIDAPEAWESTTGDPGVLVAVLDTGVDRTHPDLAPNLWRNPGESGEGRETNGIDDDGNGFVDDYRGWDFSRSSDDGIPGPDNDPQDHFGHGTHIAGTIAARGNNGIGVAGIGWHTSLLPVRLGDFDLSVAHSIRGIAYAAAMGADVANMSYGGWAPSRAEADAMRNAPGTLFVIAAGNDFSSNDRRPVYPCNYGVRNSTCVAATEQRDRLARFSNHGRLSLDLAAPGRSIMSAALAPIRFTAFVDRFQRPLRGRWHKDGPRDTWRRVVSERTVLRPRGLRVRRTRMLATSRGRYANGLDTSLLSMRLDLSYGSGCGISYWLAGRTEPLRDRLLIEARAGNGEWMQIASHSGRVRGSRQSAPLREVSGKPDVQIRLRFVTDSTLRREGYRIDDLAVRCGRRYFRLSGTSMSAAHVSGAAALVKARYPGASAVELRARLVGSVDRPRALRRATRTGGRLNVARALEPDTRPPNTRALFVRRLGKRRAQLRILSTEPLSSRLCSIDGAPAVPCGRSYKAPRLAPGRHTLRAWARDYFGNEDPTPALLRFRVGP
jgi:subtilisin family serine protease